MTENGRPRDRAAEYHPPTDRPRSREPAVEVAEGLGNRERSAGLFEPLLGRGTVFEDKDLLRPSHTPDLLPHRERQITELAEHLGATLRGDTPSSVQIYGKTGTGKTVCVRYVAGELLRAAGGAGVPCHIEYVNGEVTDTEYRVLARLTNRVAAASGTAEDDRPVPPSGWPTGQVYRAFVRAVDRQERSVVVVLDEVDRLVRKGAGDALYKLLRVNAELERSRVSVVGISNDLTFTESLDPRVRSSLGDVEVVFPPYDANQLRDVLRVRASTAFRDGSVAEGVIPLCAAFAAREHGDARRALDTLRTAGEVADAAGAERVEERHVRRARERTDVDRAGEASDARDPSTDRT
ncbi:Cdc6/Cdc18 family protein [Halomarina halobia]|uniref:ORC1-type DNA replication protein n=1 Tax=Halomarina halobia TaxID=3033386 RepID=A0ABD6ADT5_9EURY|nr:AAA family ATPase [Halomarina sp. PSR21]